MYWDINKPMSYNKLFNFIVGARGCGKTYASKDMVIRRWLQRHEEFVYLRRYDTEFDKIEKFFDDIAPKFDGHEFEVTKGNFKIDGIICGYYMPLTKSQTYKSTPFPNVSNILFDEFIIEQGFRRYLKDEVRTFLEFYSTIARLRDVKAWFLSNALTVTNPYFLFFDLKLPYGKDIATKGDILVQMVQDAEFFEVASNTRFGQLIKGTDYFDYAMSNEFLLDDNAFIGKKPNTSYCEFILEYKDKVFGIWLDRKMSYYYVSEDYDPSCHMRYSVTLDDHKPNLLLLKTIKPYLLETFLKAYSVGRVRFETMNVKNLCQEIIKLTI